MFVDYRLRKRFHDVLIAHTTHTLTAQDKNSDLRAKLDQYARHCFGYLMTLIDDRLKNLLNHP